jgi:hypothetical protein
MAARQSGKGLSEAALIAATGEKRRKITRLRQGGFIQILEPRHGLGQGGGSTPVEYAPSAVAAVKRYNELPRSERRWRMWLEEHPVTIAPYLADTLDRIRTAAQQIKTADDIQTKIPANLWRPVNLPRGNPLRAILGGLSDDDRNSLVTLTVCLVLGVRLPLFDERDPHEFRVFKRAFALPKEWRLPSGLFDVFPRMHEQLCAALRTATIGELEIAKAICRELSRMLDSPENWQRKTIADDLPWQPIRLAGLLWPSPSTRAVTVALVILCVRASKARFGEVIATIIATIAGIFRELMAEVPNAR